MKKFRDESGWLRTAVCCAVLLTQYGIRDSLLTALPNIANASTDPEVTDTTLPEATTVSSNDSNSEDYIRANLESKSNYFQRKKHERKSSKEFEFDNLTRLGFQGISERHSEAQRYLSQSLFWAKLGGRNARLAKAPPGDTRQKLEASSIFRRGKYMPLFFADGNERDVFRRLLDYIRTGNERKREDVRAYVMGDEFHVPIPVGGQNSSGGSWSTMNKGVVLSSVYWGWLITALLANYVISKLGANLVIAISVSIGSLMGLLTHASSLGGPWVLLPFRIVFGAAQGFCYPAVVRLLQGIPESSRMVAGTLVFIGPSLGSCVGVGLGSLESWYISTYLLGSLAIPLIPLCFMMPGKNDEHEKSIPVTQVLKTAGVWACIIVYVANIFTFHTALVGLPFCIAESLQITDTTGGVVLLSMILVVAIVIRVTAVLSAVIGGKIPLTVLNKRRIPVALGSLLLLVALIVLATAGLTDFGALAGLAIGCAGPGVGLTRICCRLNLEDLAPWTLPRLVNMVNIVGIFVAVWPPLLVGGLAEVGESGWVAIWLIPLAVIVPSTVAYMFLLTGNSQSWDERPDSKTSNLPNGSGPPRDSPAARGHISRLSFKSARSGLSFKSVLSFQSFKTAVSRRRSRTFSGRTVDEDLSVDMHSVIDEDGAEVYSIEGSIQDCKSAASTASFKSDGADMHSIDLNIPEDGGEQQHRPEILSGSSTDRTSAWLSHHHQVSVENAPLPAPTKEEMRRRNAIYDLFW